MGKIAYLILHCSLHVWTLAKDFKKFNKIKQRKFSQILQTRFGKFVKIKRLKVYGKCSAFKKVQQSLSETIGAKKIVESSAK